MYMLCVPGANLDRTSTLGGPQLNSVRLVEALFFSYLSLSSHVFSQAAAEGAILQPASPGEGPGH